MNTHQLILVNEELNIEISKSGDESGSYAITVSFRRNYQLTDPTHTQADYGEEKACAPECL